MVTNVIFVLFGSADQQPWNEPDFDKNDVEKNVEDSKPEREQKENIKTISNECQ